MESVGHNGENCTNEIEKSEFYDYTGDWSDRWESESNTMRSDYTGRLWVFRNCHLCASSVSVNSATQQIHYAQRNEKKRLKAYISRFNRKLVWKEHATELKWEVQIPQHWQIKFCRLHSPQTHTISLQYTKIVARPFNFEGATNVHFLILLKMPWLYVCRSIY